MRQIIVQCEGCGVKFEFQHPAIERVSRMVNIQLNCPGCDERLIVPHDRVIMTPIQMYFDRELERQGLERQVKRAAKQLEKVAEELAEDSPPPTPLIMPQRKPAPPKAYKPRPPIQLHLRQRIGDSIDPD